MNLTLGDTQLLIDTAKKAGYLRNQIAYMLATVYHESGHTMKPVKEAGSATYLHSKKYWPFIGEGYVQDTWEKNYKFASDKLGVDFVHHPELMLEPQYAAPVAIHGMQEGWFTGKKLSDYIDLNHSDWVHARRIINGLDRAYLIANYAISYDKLLLQAKV